MLLVHSGLVVWDVICTLLSIHCMYTIYYLWVSYILKISVDLEVRQKALFHVV